MLSIMMQKTDEVLWGVDRIFNNDKTKDWFNDPFVREIILGIDKTVAVKDEYLESPVFGGMSPDRLSTGCKAVILMYVQDRPVYATKCGDNCSKYILEVAKRKDITICLQHCLMGWGSIPFEMKFLDSGIIVTDLEGYVREYYRLRDMGF